MDRYHAVWAGVLLLVVGCTQRVSGPPTVNCELRWCAPYVSPLHAVLVTGSYGKRTSPFTGERVSHNGIDLAADIGTPVHAAGWGTVHMVGAVSGYGTIAILDHGQGLRTIYAHLSTVLVVPGQAVSPGERIALSGDTGRTDGPHLHFEINVCKRGRDRLERCWPRNPGRFIRLPATKKITLDTHSDLLVQLR